ncbi:MAG: flagellar biosynthesis anti-sigma factor FlgM [Nitrospirota bacterium]|nr:flagellar biosynthesis anti-sigma factor FlgM [Nitrospirota bacterium]
MNPLSSIPPTPPRDASSSPLTETVLSSHDASNDASAISSDRARNDTVSLSAPTQEISYYLERMSQIPDIRQARIAHIQQAIDSQTYSISPEKLADSLIQELQSHPQETRPPTTS